MIKDNYYNILEIPETANPDEIRKAYRKLSLQHHPDRNKNNPEAMAKTQKINEAYETLSDADKKREYDMMRSNPFFNGSFANGVNGEPNFDDLMSQLFGGMGMGMGGGQVPIFHMGGFPNGMGGIHVFRTSAMDKPAVIVKSVTISIDKVLTGVTMPIDVERWVLENGTKVTEHETIYINIPKGIDENEIMILREKGNVISETNKGDIKIIIKIENTTEFKRHGLDLVLEKNITLKDALCGFSFEMKYINGKTYTINNSNKQVIKPHYKKIIPNMGLSREDHVGNLIIVFDIIFPERLTDEQCEKIKEILP